jgi:hypothetical protein
MAINRRFFYSKQCLFKKKLDYNIVFLKKNASFFPENWGKSQKIVTITSARAPVSPKIIEIVEISD